MRRVLLCGSYSAKSNIDKEIVPDNVADAVSYMPRGIQISLLSPFPNSWFDRNKSLTWLVGVTEIIIMYIFIPGIFLAVYKKKSFEKLFTIIFSLTFLTIFDNSGSIFNVSIIKYREAYGGEIRNKNWLKQFSEYTDISNYKLGNGIHAISGATISVQSISKGIHKLTLIINDVMESFYEE